MRTFPTLLASSALALLAPFAVASSPSQATPGEQTSTRTIPATAAEPDPDNPRTWQTSDRVEGDRAAFVPRYQRGVVDRDRRFKFEVAPGINAMAWDERDARGPVRYYLVRARWVAKGVRTDYMHAPVVKQTEPVSTMVARTRRAVVGVNGDFFDIGDTGAPFGLGRSRADGLIHGIDYGWNAAFYFGDAGRPRMDVLNMRAKVEERPRLAITNVNSPQVKPGGIGIYTPRWGYTSGFRWTDGQRDDVRMVHVVGGKVVENRRRHFPSGTEIKGRYLIARGAKAADQLRSMEKGDPITTRWWLPDTPRMAITGNRIILKDGKVLTTDDGEMHPRTAIGIDRDSKSILLLVVDGRQSFSRGYTMEELAKKLKRLGAEDGLNLDGGGSSTLVALRNGALRVLNSPSDGQQRSVPNGVQVTYNPNAG